MNINIYSTYNVKIYCKGCYISEDSTPDDIIFSSDEGYQEKVMFGHDLIDYLGSKMRENDIFSINILENVNYAHANEVDLEYFNPNSGESSEITIFITPVKVNTFENPKNHRGVVPHVKNE